MLSLLLFALSAHAAVPRDIADALATGDCATVLRALPSPAADDERLVAGRCLRKTGHPSEAAATLEAIRTPGALADWGRYERALALADADRPADAIAALDGLSLPGEFGTSLRLLRDRLLVQSGKSTEARADLNLLLEADAAIADEARFWLAKGAEDRGEAEAAVPVYQKLWSTSVRGDWSDRAAVRLSALGHPVSDLDDATTRSFVKARASALRKANRHQDALALMLLLEKVAPGTSSTSELAHTKFDAHDYAGARDDYSKLLGAPDQASGSAANLFEYALTTARAGDYDTAAIIYKRCTAAYPDEKEGEFASFKLGYMEYDRGNLDAARTELLAHLKRYPSGAHATEARWFAARAAWRNGDLATADAELAALIEAAPSSDLTPGAVYWRARKKGLEGDAAGEKAALDKLIASYPTSGHAWYAAHRTGRTFPHQARVDRPAWPADFASRKDVQRGESLLAIGFVREAHAELAPVRKPAAAAGRDTALAAAWAFIGSGDYQAGIALAKPYCTSPWKAGDPVAQQACTPMPEATIVARVADKYGLDPLLPYGIMIAESALDPTVTSIAGARGLMQIMPAELGRIHGDLYGDGPNAKVDPDDLYVAPYNAAIGTAELGQKWQSLGSILTGTSEPAVVASYNGGEEAVRRWVGDDKPEFDAFAEDVGYTETRQYVRRVLGYVMAYRWVYGDS